jgi:hypothetical protein
LPASPCSRFVTSYHLISHRHVNVRSTSGQRAGRADFGILACHSSRHFHRGLRSRTAWLARICA